MRLSTTLFSSLALAAVLGGCESTMYSQYSEPYALLESEHRMSMQNILPALVVAIDGKTVPAGRKEPLKPGSHRVDVSIPGLAAGNTRTITVDAQPCMRYYLGAKRSGADWTVSVTETERIGGCK